MKKNYILIILFFITSIASAQIITIPDANFKTRLLQSSTTQPIAYNSSGNKIKIDTNNNGEIELSETFNVAELNVSGRSIADLTGINEFGLLNKLNCSNNLLTTLSLNYISSLNCSHNSLTSLTISSLNSLQTLNCSFNSLTSLNVTGTPNTPIRDLDCSNNQIATMNLSTAYELRTLNCNNNQLTTLNLNANFLTQVWCKSNQLSTLNLTNVAGLTSLDCSGNQLTNLNLSGLSHLNSINCSNNFLTSLDATASIASMFYLDIYNNLFTSINLNQYVNLNHLNVGKNPFTSLNIDSLSFLIQLWYMDSNPAFFPLNMSNSSLFPYLEKIYCHNTPLGSINFNVSAFPSLYELWVRNCNLSALNISSPTLYYVIADNNNIQSFDASGIPNLYTLQLSNNPITSVNLATAINLGECYIHNAQLTSLDLSASTHLDKLTVYNNPQLNYFNIKNGVTESLLTFNNCSNLNYICADETEIPSVQGIISGYGYQNCQVNTYCSFEPGGTVYTLAGNAKLDADLNGCDTNDGGQSLKFTINTGTSSGTLIANASGNFNLPLNGGTYTITPILENPSYFSVSPTVLNLNFPTQNSPVTQNFCIVPNGVHNDVEISMIPIGPARPGFNANYKILFKNKGTNMQSGSFSIGFEDSKMDFISSTLTAVTQTNGLLSWNYSNLLPLETRSINVVFNINSPIEVPAVNNGDLLDFVASINPISGDEITADNVANLTQTVVGSYDPNDKTCIEGTVVSSATIGEYVHYVIRFENTGTFPAENIVVRDIIDTSKFDIASLIPLNSSHLYVTRILNGNQVEFIFESINLPFDDANNDGYVACKIKTKPTLVIGDSFSNTANIYFDYNAPIVTNTATTSIQALANTDFDFSAYFALAPNPVKDNLTIRSSQTIDISSLSIYNTLGQLVLTITQPENTIDVSALKTGSYFIKIISDKGSTVTKFLKE